MEEKVLTVRAAQVDKVHGGQIIFFARGEGEKVVNVIRGFPFGDEVSRLHLSFLETSSIDLMIDTTSSVELIKNRQLLSGHKKITLATMEEIRGISRVQVDKGADKDSVVEVIKNFPWWPINRFKTELILELENRMTITLRLRKVEGELVCQVVFTDERA